jgi:hypothetical protein
MSQISQVFDIREKLQVSKIAPTFTYWKLLEDKKNQICVLTISDPHFTPFSDISLKHRIFFMVGFQIFSGHGGIVNISRFEKQIILI